MEQNLSLEGLQDADRAALLQAWTTVFGTHPPRKTSQSFMRMKLGYHIQSKQLGGLDTHSKRALKKLQNTIQTATTPISKKAGKQTANLAPGACLLREWNGKTYRVDVTDDGYVWQGAPFKSLSAIAFAITGTRWSGPRFFGTRQVTI